MEKVVIEKIVQLHKKEHKNSQRKKLKMLFSSVLIAVVEKLKLKFESEDSLYLLLFYNLRVFF